MRARSVPLGSMFSWIPATFRMVTRNFGAMAVATILTLLAGVLLALPIFFFMFKSLSGLGSPGVPQPQDMTGFWIAYAVCIVGGMLLMPPLLAGWFRMCAAADRGEAVSGAQVLAPYGDRDVWIRLVVFALIGILAYAVVFGLLFLLFGGAFKEIMAMQAAQEAALATGAAPPPPNFALLGQIFVMYAVALPTLIVLQFIYMVGLSEVSLRPTGAPAAFVEAAGGVLRNLLKLLLLMLCLWMGAGVLIFVVVLVLGVVVAALMMLSPVAAMIVGGLFYLALLLLIYPLMFAGHYHMWRDMLGDDAPPALPA